MNHQELYTIFPQLVLYPNLFYHNANGIRFELGDSTLLKNIGLDDPNYLESAYRKALTLFEAIHAPSDLITWIVQVSPYKRTSGWKPVVHSGFVKYLKSPSFRYRLRCDRTPQYVEEHPYATYTLSLTCTRQEIHYPALIRDICSHDVTDRPSFIHRTFFFNPRRKSLFHIYDDRGCDLIGETPDAIRDLYDDYKHWILKHDKNTIDQTFSL